MNQVYVITLIKEYTDVEKQQEVVIKGIATTEVIKDKIVKEILNSTIDTALNKVIFEKMAIITTNTLIEMYESVNHMTDHTLLVEVVPVDEIINLET